MGTGWLHGCTRAASWPVLPSPSHPQWSAAPPLAPAASCQGAGCTAGTRPPAAPCCHWQLLLCHRTSRACCQGSDAARRRRHCEPGELEVQTLTHASFFCSTTEPGNNCFSTIFGAQQLGRRPGTKLFFFCLSKLCFSVSFYKKKKKKKRFILTPRPG